MSRGAAGTFALNLVHRPLALLVAALIARFLGPESFGIYSYAIAVLTVLAIPVQYGMPTLLVRQIVSARSQDQWGLLRGVLRRATSAALLFSVLVPLCALVVLWTAAGNFSEEALSTALWSLVLLPFLALGPLRGAALRGLGRVVQGQLPENLVEPLLLGLLVGAWYSMMGHLAAPTTMALHVVAAGGAFVVGATLLWVAIPGEARQASPEYADRAWLRAVLPLALIGGLHLINHHADILLLGILRSQEEVGMYRVAALAATLVIFGLTTLNLAVGPQIARLHTMGRITELQKIIHWSARFSSIIALPAATLFILLGGPLLRWTVGIEYLPVAPALKILALGQLANAATGSVGLLLTMTGHERDAAIGMALAAGANIALNIVLIPIWGMEGAAISTAVTLLSSNLLLVLRARQRLGIWSTPLGSLSK